MSKPSEEERQRLLENYVQARSGSVQDRPAIPRRAPGTIAPLTFAQQELWRRETQTPEIAPLYNECITVRMRGPLDRAALEKSLNEIVRRHEIWRTTFETRAGQPVQIVHPVQIGHQAAPVPLRSLDAGDFSEPESLASRGEGFAADAIPRWHAAVREDVSRKFALHSEPPIRATLVKLGKNEHRLFVAAHLMVLDGISAYQIFPAELAALYRAFAAGKASPLAELPIQYGDFARWQREAGTAKFPSQIEYWRKQLTESRVTDLPLGRQSTDIPSSSRASSRRPRAPEQSNGERNYRGRSYRGMIRPFAFSPELSCNLREFAKREKASVFQILVAAFGILLWQESQEQKITLGTPVSSGRSLNEVQKLIGYFLNTVALRLNFEGDPTFHELVAQAGRVLLEAMTHADVPIEHLAREIAHDPNPGPSPFFRAVIGMQPPTPNLGMNAGLDGGLDWDVTTMDVDSGGSPWEFYLAFIDHEQPRGWQTSHSQPTDTSVINIPPIRGRLQFNPESIDVDAAMGIVADLKVVLEEVVTNPLRRISEIRIS